jgi:hypothetical protein
VDSVPAWIRTLLLLLLIAASTASAASAAVIHPSVSPTVLRGQGPWEVTYKLELDSGPADEHVVISATNGNGSLPTPVLDGPGTLTPGPALIAIADRFCAGGGGSFSFETAQAEWALDLPANSVNTISITTPVSRRFGYDELRLQDVSFRIDGAPIDLPGPEIVASRDAGITLTAAGKRFAAIGADARVALRGQTSPLLAGDRIDLLAGYAPEPPYRTLKLLIPVQHVRVRADGSFGYRWRPPRPGRWTVAALLDSHDPRFLDSGTNGCFPVVQVGAAG